MKEDNEEINKTISNKYGNLVLWFFYKEVILYYEKKVLPSPLGFHVSNKDVTEYLSALNAFFDCVPSSVTIMPPTSYRTTPVSFFIMHRAYDRMSGRGLSILASFLWHLRNSFAHGRFEFNLIEGQEYLCVYDIKVRGGKKGIELSMIAQAPIDSFIFLINTIKKSQKVEK